ncbi:hypothetical protein EVG20_g4535 [Dentipellis fragilis]|uniref:Uncharacterized protein n=1 Tax=Dentipellis fragilis TaxID=205917 RepID=A0A4Y9YYC2_9AGAM|nr:hypothetical protein EVG20_g4535 [Dentipellis fragilis]
MGSKRKDLTADDLMRLQEGPRKRRKEIPSADVEDSEDEGEESGSESGESSEDEEEAIEDFEDTRPAPRANTLPLTLHENAVLPPA